MSFRAQVKFPAGPPWRLRTWKSGLMGTDPLAFFTELTRQYGDVAGLRLLNFCTIFVNHPDYIEDMLEARRRTRRAPGDAAADAAHRGQNIVRRRRRS